MAQTPEGPERASDPSVPGAGGAGGVLNLLSSTKIVAVVRLAQYDRAVEVARALHDGGLRAVEFTLTGAGALEAVAAVQRAFGADLAVGAGTVLDGAAAGAAIDSGAQFVVTPTLALDVIAACRARGVPVVCGAFTPTEAQSAHAAGAELVKIFPARLGGPAYIRDLLAPLPHLRLVPTGGIRTDQVRAYLEAGAFAVGLGGNLVPSQAVAYGDWEQIAAAARACVAAAQGA